MRFADFFLSRRVMLAGWLVLTMGSTGCRSSNAPRAYRQPAAISAKRVSGSWVQVRSTGGTVTSGELLAAGDTVWVIADSTLTPVPRDSVRDVTLTRYDPRGRDLGVLTVLGIASTISHGWWLILTAPTWAIGGASAVAAESHRAIWKTSDVSKLTLWSRFPAGIPANVERSRLRESPRESPAGRRR